MEQIAAAAGVTKPILYRHVGGRGAFVQALTERFADQVTSALERAVVDEPDPRAALAAAIDAYLTLIERDPELYRFTVQRVVEEEPGGYDLMMGVLRRVGQVDVILIGERLREMGLDSGAAEPWGFGLVGMVHAAGEWWLEHRTMPRQRLVEYLVTLVWDGMAGATRVTASRESDAQSS